MSLFEEYVENPIKMGALLVLEIIMSVWIIIFKQSEEITDIRSKDFGALQEALEIIKVPEYFTHLIFGLIWALMLIIFIYWSFRERRFIASLIYLIFLIVFWIIFWDPIVTTILTIVVSASLLLLSMDS